MPKPSSLALALRCSTSVVHAAIAALHDAGALTMRHVGKRLVVVFPDGMQTAGGMGQ